jgi:hypothetical protein
MAVAVEDDARDDPVGLAQRGAQSTVIILNTANTVGISACVDESARRQARLVLCQETSRLEVAAAGVEKRLLMIVRQPRKRDRRFQALGA